MSPTVQRVTECLELGEAPHWDVATQSLYFVDIFGKTIHRYVPATGKHYKASLATGHVSMVVPVEGQTDKFLVTAGPEVVLVTWDGESDKVADMEKLYEIEEDPTIANNWFNAGKIDPCGRLWAKSIGGKPEDGHINLNIGFVYSFDFRSDLIVKKHLINESLSDGIAWSLDHKYMYCVDSPKRAIDQYDFDAETGNIANGRCIFVFTKHDIPGIPDGIAVDADGNIWVGVLEGHRVIKIDGKKPETLLQTIPIPANQTTSVAFGGPNLDEMYVTSGAFTIQGVELPPPDHGATYKVIGLGVKGLPGVRVKLSSHM